MYWFLYLEEINKCDYSGNINLEKLIEYAKTLGIVETIELTDESTIFDKKISLWLLSILTTSDSWIINLNFFKEIINMKNNNEIWRFYKWMYWIINKKI